MVYGLLDERRVATSPNEAEEVVVEGLAEHVKSVEGRPGSRGLILTVTLKGGADDFSSSWHANLAAGAYVERSGASKVSYNEVVESVSSTTSVGDSHAQTLGIGAAALGQAFDSGSDEAINSRLRDVSSDFGLSLATTEILHPLDSAVAVTFVVDDALRPEWTISDLESAITGSPASVEGVMISLVSPTGQPLLKTSASYRTGNGALWFAPGQDVRFRAAHGTGPWG